MKEFVRVLNTTFTILFFFFLYHVEYQGKGKSERNE